MRPRTRTIARPTLVDTSDDCRRAYANEGARGGRTRHEVHRPARRLLRLAALQAEHLPCPARLASGIAPLQKKLHKIGTQHQYRTLAVDDGQPSLDPMADCIPMDFQGAGDFVDRVAARRFQAGGRDVGCAVSRLAAPNV